jgi:hypothetical protein
MSYCYTREIKDIAKVGYMKGRRFADIAKDISCNPETVSKWAKQEGWSEERLRLCNESTALATREDSILTVSSMMRKIDAYQDMLTKGIQALQETPVKSATEASQLIDKAFKGFQAIRQDALQVSFIEEIATVLKSEIPDVHLRRRIADGFRKVHERYCHDTTE